MPHPVIVMSHHRRNGVKLARELARMPALSEILESELHPGNEVQVGGRMPNTPPHGLTTRRILTALKPLYSETWNSLYIAARTVAQRYVRLNAKIKLSTF